MLTVREFKTAHSLSDSAFKRLTARVRSARPNLNLTARVPGSSTEWQVLEPEILIQAGKEPVRIGRLRGSLLGRLASPHDISISRTSTSDFTLRSSRTIATKL